MINDTAEDRSAMDLMAGFEIKDGEYTKTIYGMIKEQRLV